MKHKQNTLTGTLTSANRPPSRPMTSNLITVDPDIQSGAPVFAGTRVPVQNHFDDLEESDSLDVFLRQFPSVTRDQAIAVLEKARVSLVADAHI